MPRLAKTIIPRIKKSIERRGVVASIFRGVLLPIQLFREHRTAKQSAGDGTRSEFDLKYIVDTDGDTGGVTFLSDLDIPSPNWIYGFNYLPVDPDQFRAAMTALKIEFEDFFFIDYGSGKGRALLFASNYPFKKIVGIEFAPELHAIAVKNIGKYSSPEQKCGSLEAVCMDFTDFSLPPEPLVLFFNRPCEALPLGIVLGSIRKSLRENPRPIYIVFIAPAYEEIEAVLDGAEFLVKIAENPDISFIVYESVQHA
jgi:hypothetical protein